VKSLWPIAYITFKEGIRNRTIYGISIFALLVLSINLLICSMIMREVSKVAVDIALSSVSFAGLLVVLFVGINLLAKDFDKKTIYMVLSKPVSRSHYIIGKFLGISALILVLMLILGVFAYLSIFLVKITYPSYFAKISVSMIFLALVYASIGLLLLLSTAFLFAAISSNSFVTFMLTVITYIVGHSIGDVKEMLAMPDTYGVTSSTSLQKIVDVAYYVFPNLSFFDLKAQAANVISVSIKYYLFSAGYGLFYIALVLFLASMVFHRREFP